MHSKPVFIADGHHRYETGLRYLEERRAAGEAVGDEAACNFTMMMLVSMSDPGLIILPTHRLISGIADFTADKLQTLLAPHFQIEKMGTGQAAGKETWEQIEMDGSQALLGFHTNADDAWLTARFKSPGLMNQLAPEHSDDWRDLAVSVLHVVVLNHLLGGAPKCRYVHFAKRSRCRDRRQRVPARGARAARDDGSCGKHRRQSREDAAEINVFLSQAIDWLGF